ncbi:hypothetical protein KY317_03665, partial [Candidatus Woesearchaeota archaeon]|nr:hypothetical protein [Candidatus Woesearchaeota archaeon]
KNRMIVALPLIAIIAILFYIGYAKYMHLKKANPEGASAEIKRLFAPHIKKIMPEIKNPIKPEVSQLRKQVKHVQKVPKAKKQIVKLVKPVKKTIPKHLKKPSQKMPKKPNPAFSSYKESRNMP